MCIAKNVVQMHSSSVRSGTPVPRGAGLFSQLHAAAYGAGKDVSELGLYTWRS